MNRLRGETARLRIFAIVMMLFMVVVLAVPERAVSQEQLSPANAIRIDWQKDKIQIRNANGDIYDLYIEVAQTPQQRQIGLMFRKYMSEDHGMLFIFEKDDIQRFWMRNTYIPLDMIFIDSNGRVRHVHKNARPHDESIISSVVPVRAVLEINAGMADKLGISVIDEENGAGTTILYDAFGTAALQ